MSVALQTFETMRRPATRHFSGIIESIGEPHFCQEFLRFLNSEFGVDYCGAFKLRTENFAQPICASGDGTETARSMAKEYKAKDLWVRDPLMKHVLTSANEQSSICSRQRISDLEGSEVTRTFYEGWNICDRLAIYTCYKGSVIGMGLIRRVESGQFRPSDIRDLKRFLDPLLSTLIKHCTILQKDDVASGLTSLDQIETTIACTSPDLPRREAQVSARILYGMSTAGIAVDLGISEETVSTYRKRVYDRLQIATQRELLLWYLRNFSRFGPVTAH